MYDHYPNAMFSAFQHMRIILNESCRRRLAWGIALVTLLGLPLAPPLASSDKGSLEAARAEYALHFFSAEAHVRLARTLYDQGERLQSFYILESARRDHFTQEDFDRAFRRIFRS